MAEHSKIEWTDATWNVVTGCSVVSPGCKLCYAMTLAGTRLKHHPSRAGLTVDTKAGPVWTGEVRFNAEWLDQPLRWKRPRRIFVAAHGDLFHEGVTDEVLDKVFAVMALTPQHTFQVLTKRAERMRRYVEGLTRQEWWKLRLAEAAQRGLRNDRGLFPDWPLPWVWLGVSAEDQQRAEERIPDLLETPAAVRFLSAEPLLGPIDLSQWIEPTLHCGACGAEYGLDQALPDPGGHIHGADKCAKCGANNFMTSTWGDDALRQRDEGDDFDLRQAGEEWDHGFRLHWIIAGGESGPGARPMHPDWARSLRDQCQAAGVPFFFKQWGEWAPVEEPASETQEDEELRNRGTFFNGQYLRRLGKKVAGRVLDGRTWDQMPEAQR